MIRNFPKRRYIPFITIITLFIFNASLSFAGQYKVARVIDGNTFVVYHGSVKITVRLVGIDAPENSNHKRRDGQPFSRQSTQHLAGLVLNKTVDVKSYGADRNGRTLGEVFLLDGKNINIEMIKVGLAEVYRGKPASGLDMEQYRNAEGEAKAAKQGMWVQEDKYVSPREWRRMHGS
jgi:endonuclease YncB( thermonuclease family)